MPNDSFYTNKKWRNLREYKLAINPFCEMCGVVATEIHHKKDRQSSPEFEYDINNLQSLCKSCHSRHTVKEKTLKLKNWQLHKKKYK